METILVIIDGCRPDGLDQAETPNIDHMIENGVHTLSAATVSPPFTLPVHFSIFTSLKPIDHNVLSNTGSPALSPDARSIIDVVKDFLITTGTQLCRPGAIPYPLYGTL